jgi:methionyl aminopeptidase
MQDEREEGDFYSDEEMDQWFNAAKLAAKTLAYGKKLVKNGASVLQVSDKIDKYVYDNGGIPAWPVQLSFDHVAAHQCADPEDERIFNDNLVKVDAGVHINGFIGDNAVTVDLSGKYKELVQSSRDALNTVSKLLHPGVTVTDLGKSIQETITSYGYSPIKNLSGHTISRYVIHDQPTIPNIATGDKTPLEEGDVIAIEPFATTGKGMIYESDVANLYALEQKKPLRSPFARHILSHIEKNYGVFPFTTRWLVKDFGKGKTAIALREMQRVGMLHTHPPLVEQAKGMVAQSEHTYLITEDGMECMTKWDES